MNTPDDKLNATPWTLVNVLDLLQLSLNELERNPPPNEFYRGYQWAFENLKTVLSAEYHAYPKSYPGGRDCMDCVPNAHSRILPKIAPR